MAALCRLLGVLVSLVALVGVVVTGVLVARRTNERPSTYDATIQAYIVNMAPEVSGRIVELNVVDNQQVKKGQVLFQIDPKPYQLSVDQARTAKETAQVAPGAGAADGRASARGHHGP